ncbi:hypothetical protein GGD81_004681 [Rhodobium orientis]|uniref:Uncharacterized protein n=1 Tax=Rhodobium orientis TaxID=34017 RepID=A0A327JJK0_9HYPH|nr:hypothetical protein [Rhodobium orientis]MBB4305600.1 hypothetical protein [Rhodobium orientis]MBK5950863.1 hypothetical protein [Rhodobium orientis]RAI24972.1 hypothetical protein CH339_20275 [Rhodobium orientis]
MMLDMSRPTLKMKSVKLACDNAPAGPKKDEALRHLLAAEKAHEEMAEALANNQLDEAIAALR